MTHVSKAEKQKYDRDWYHQNKEELKDRKAKSAREFRARRNEWLSAQKDRPCTDCGGKFPACAMEFDHVSGKKKFNISDKKASISTEELLKEISKCELVCANCHAIRTEARLIPR